MSEGKGIQQEALTTVVWLQLCVVNMTYTFTPADVYSQPQDESEREPASATWKC